MNALSVFTPRRFGRLLASDALNVARDPTLAFATLFSLAPAIALFLGKSPMDEAAEAAFGIVDLSRYLAPVALCLPAYLLGWVTGFLFLESRDEGTLMAIDVTPVGKTGLMAYRLIATVIVTIAVTLFGAQLVVPELGWPLAAFVAVLVALQAVSVTLLLPVIARNKVEGLALTKIINLAALAPLVAVVPSPWRHLAGVVPSFWLGEIFNLSETSYLPPAAIVTLALTTHASAAVLLYRLSRHQRG